MFGIEVKILPRLKEAFWFWYCYLSKQKIVKEEMLNFLI